MSIPAWDLHARPEQAILTVRTGRAGAAAKAGHNLVIEVGSWNATLHCADDPAATTVRLTADSTSLRVLEGSGGMQAHGDDDKLSILKSIDDDVLKRGTIEFHSSRLEPSADGGRVNAEATVTQSDFGIKPYSTLFGALKVVDAVQVSLEGRLAFD